MTMRAGTGRSTTTTDWRRLVRGLSGVAVLIAWPALAAPPPAPADDAQAAHLVEQDQGLRARMMPDQPAPVRRLDAAIFTELLPVTAAEPALRLPADQVDLEPSGNP